MVPFFQPMIVPWPVGPSCREGLLPGGGAETPNVQQPPYSSRSAVRDNITSERDEYGAEKESGDKSPHSKESGDKSPQSKESGDKSPHSKGHWYLADDYSFCERARQCGYKIMADTSIRLWHIGEYAYGWEDAGLDRPRHDSFLFLLPDGKQA